MFRIVAKICRFTLLIATAVLVSPASAAPLIFKAGFEPVTQTIEFVGDQSIVFDSADDTTTFEVLVKDIDGNEIITGDLVWSADGGVSFSNATSRTITVTADSFSVGTTTIDVTHPETNARASATVIMAVLAANTLIVQSDDVLSGQSPLTGQSVLVLVRNAQTEALQAGDLIISGDKAGIMVRVVAVQLSPNEVTLTVEPAAMTDVFEHLGYIRVSQNIELI